MTNTPYQSLVAAASQVVDEQALALLEWDDVSTAADLVQRNRGPLDSARKVLGPQCRVPLRYAAAFFAEHADDTTHLRNLARAFRAESLLAAAYCDFARAARCGVDCLDLANGTRRGGLVVDALISQAISSMALNVLRKIRPRLDSQTRRFVIGELYRLENEREPFSEIEARDRRWVIEVDYQEEPHDFTSHEISDPEECGLSEEDQRELLAFLQLIAELPNSEHQRMYENLECREVALSRMLVIDLALREAFHAKGRFPSGLATIAAPPFAQLPRDPFTGNSFIYRRTNDFSFLSFIFRRTNDSSFLLYSTGPKRYDGGGKFGCWIDAMCNAGDFHLDSYDASLEC